MLSLPHALRFLPATDPDALTRVLGVVYRAIFGFLLGKAGLTRASGTTGAVTQVQRFVSSLNLNSCFHMIFRCCGLPAGPEAAPVFRQESAPTGAERQALVQRIAERVGRLLERHGLVEHELENAWLKWRRDAGCAA